MCWVVELALKKIQIESKKNPKCAEGRMESIVHEIVQLHEIR